MDLRQSDNPLETMTPNPFHGKPSQRPTLILRTSEPHCLSVGRSGSQRSTTVTTSNSVKIVAHRANGDGEGDGSKTKQRKHVQGRRTKNKSPKTGSQESRYTRTCATCWAAKVGRTRADFGRTLYRELQSSVCRNISRPTSAITLCGLLGVCTVTMVPVKPLEASMAPLPAKILPRFFAFSPTAHRIDATSVGP